MSAIRAQAPTFAYEFFRDEHPGFDRSILTELLRHPDAKFLVVVKTISDTTGRAEYYPHMINRLSQAQYPSSVALMSTYWEKRDSAFRQGEDTKVTDIIYGDMMSEIVEAHCARNEEPSEQYLAMRCHLLEAFDDGGSEKSNFVWIEVEAIPDTGTKVSYFGHTTRIAVS